MLHDQGALMKPPLSGKITWRVTHPEREPKTEKERVRIEKGRAMVEWVREKVEEKKLRKGQ